MNRYGVSRPDLTQLLAGWGEPRYRADQVWEGLYGQRLPLEAITNLPKELRARLDDALPLALTEQAHQTGDAGMTSKWLWTGGDGAQVETVLMRYPDRATVCVSSQAGCAMACTFCATGQAGFERHLDVGEIVEQVVRAQWERPDQRVGNVVFMGMGEPLANEEPVFAAVERIHDDLGISARQITVSTVGVAPAMRRMASFRLPVTLAVSLHAPDDDVRSELVPLNRRYPLADVLDAARGYLAVKGRRVTFEYVMLAGVNDTTAHADALGRLLTGPAYGRPAHVNLIPYNPTAGLDASASGQHALAGFAAVLERPGVTVTIRKNRGIEIDAACGQLRARARQ
ncbi:MAG: 23S rRNA (adenine(2503)-C(2))-methyltransferase RlmN [Actinobacteria bacterium]|nr:23S rRNA (adenine(2503)-C(2))-methyltransferase RlmN [Actinomycetota bacterium]